MEEEIRKLRETLNKMPSEDTQSHQLKAEIKRTDQEIELRKKEIQELQKENSELKECLSGVWEEYNKYKTSSEQSLNKLREDIYNLQNTQSENPTQESSSHHQELHLKLTSLTEELSKLEESVAAKEETIAILDSQLNSLQHQNEELEEALTSSNLSQPAEPPPDNPIIDIHRFAPDVGSTGTWKPEESKNQNASPDPFENLFHQSTGETSHQFQEEPPTPPRSFEEEQKEGTPKRDEALSGRASRSSTPPRGAYERGSPAPFHGGQRVHNLTQPSNPTHYSIPNEEDPEDFFALMTREVSERPRRGNLPRGLFE